MLFSMYRPCVKKNDLKKVILIVLQNSNITTTLKIIKFFNKKKEPIEISLLYIKA